VIGQALYVDQPDAVVLATGNQEQRLEVLHLIQEPALWKWASGIDEPAHPDVFERQGFSVSDRVFRNLFFRNFIIGLGRTWLVGFFIA
jgi:hypothetical protein